MKTLLIDNYDSFTYNLFQLLAEVNGEEPVVVRNDEATWPELAELACENVVISPGPGRPNRVGDFGVCAEVIRRASLPLLGVCLGHQGLATTYGGAVGSAPEAMHGRLSTIVHDGSPLFAGIPREFEAVRYHSLSAVEPLPQGLAPIAWSDDGVLMALEHRSRPQWGVQFHPESVCTEYGRRLVENFRDLTAASKTLTSDGSSGRRRRGTFPNARAAPALECSGKGPSPAPPRKLLVRRLDAAVDTESAFVHLYAQSEHAFWLDSSSEADERARFSFIGDASGPLAATITYDVELGEVRVERGGRVELRRESIFEYLESELRRLQLPKMEKLPFDFDCGFVGYFGYELKADCGGEAVHASPHPDAAFLFADRLIAFDRKERCAYLLCLVEAENEVVKAGNEAQGRRWIAEVSERLMGLTSLEESEGQGASGPVDVQLTRSRERYLEDIEECKRLLVAGETYEVCLTNKVLAETDADPLRLYRVLRRANPAPFAAFLRFGELALLSSSPERFLHVDRNRRVEATPVKGTSRRGTTEAEDEALAAELASSEKDRAENLMIADLLRNDLGTVCEVGSVHVPSLIEVETQARVHQLVSTIRGRLCADVSAVECVRACFPPGSMTGAPKRRTMEILDRLEGDARGPYSGALGYLGLGGGCDLSVVIRTIVLDGGGASIGTGGAIVALSDPGRELEEVLLKASAPLVSISQVAAPDFRRQSLRA